MKVNVLGRKIEIRVEYLVIGVIILLILMTLWGWYLKTHRIEVFDASDAFRKQEFPASDAEQTRDAGIPSQAFPPSDLNTGEKEGANADENRKVNINTDGMRELLTLHGIGEVKAKAIIEYREKNGPFQSIEAIKNVKGIGDVTFQKNRERITIEPHPDPSQSGS